MTDLIEKAVEAVQQSDILPDELAETIVQLPRAFTARQMGIVVGVGISSTIMAGLVGYRVAEKRLSTKFEKLMAEETEKMREHYIQKARARTEKMSPEEVAELAELRRLQDERDSELVEDLVTELEYRPTADAVMQEAREKAAGAAREQYAIQQANQAAAEVEAPVEPINVFTERDKAEAEILEWDYAKEMKARDPRFPYIIHIDEWQENLSEYEKIDLTFYEGDEVLCDDNDQVVGDVEESVGFDNMGKFGHGSGDPNVVFVRNDVREILYEVARSHGTYAQEVHGFDPDQLKHSDERRRVRRGYDDD